MTRQSKQQGVTPEERAVLAALRSDEPRTLRSILPSVHALGMNSRVGTTPRQVEPVLRALVRRRLVEERQPMGLHDPGRGIEYTITKAGRAALRQAPSP
jgi:DNA-binding MarR family transcriptional regulator